MNESNALYICFWFLIRTLRGQYLTMKINQSRMNESKTRNESGKSPPYWRRWTSNKDHHAPSRLWNWLRCMLNFRLLLGELRGQYTTMKINQSRMNESRTINEPKRSWKGYSDPLIRCCLCARVCMRAISLKTNWPRSGKTYYCLKEDRGPASFGAPQITRARLNFLHGGKRQILLKRYSIKLN